MPRFRQVKSTLTPGNASVNYLLGPLTAGDAVGAREWRAGQIDTAGCLMGGSSQGRMSLGRLDPFRERTTRMHCKFSRFLQAFIYAPLGLVPNERLPETFDVLTHCCAKLPSLAQWSTPSPLLRSRVLLLSVITLSEGMRVLRSVQQTQTVQQKKCLMHFDGP